MENLAISHDPRSWKDFYYHEKPSRILKNCLSANKQPFSLFVSGPTGVGKTSLVRLYLKALHCRNRKPGEYNPCGECPTCKADPRTTGSINNVVWVQRGKDDTITSQVNAALAEAFQPPNGLDEEHRYYKAVVFDEIQSIPRNLLQELLFYPELPQLLTQNRVIFIFLTMDEERIDPVVLQALKDRSLYLKLRTIGDANIFKFLHKKYPLAPLESLQLIARSSNGSLRGALSTLEKCLLVDSSLHPHEVADTLGFASASIRKELWKLIESCGQVANSYLQLSNSWRVLEEKVDPQRLIEQLDDDIDMSMCLSPMPDQLRARAYLYDYKTSYARLRAFDVVKMLGGMKVINYEIFKDPSLLHFDRNGFERISESIPS